MQARKNGQGLAFWLSITRETFRGVFRAWRIRVLGPETEITLPPVSPDVRVPDGVLRRVVRLVKTVVYVLFFWRYRKWCFYRSYALAHVLRPLGVPIEMNFGIEDLAADRRPAAHCWLTIDGKPFEEKQDTRERFPTRLGSRLGRVHYWVGSDEEKNTRCRSAR